MSNLWEKILSELRKTITSEEIECYFEDMIFLSEDDFELKISKKDPTTISFIEENYCDRIHQIAVSLGKSPDFAICILSENEPNECQTKTTSDSKNKKSVRSNIKLFRNYTFDQFVVGKNNQFAHAAALSVAENPSNSYNPLYIHGPSGLGKSHLLHAIAKKLIDTQPHLNICLTTSEEFTNRYIYSLSKNKVNAFRNDFRNVDILLIDDIEFLSGKEATQEEFFHTFNSLHSQHCLIVLTSDCEPSKLKRLEDRIVSRFQWGLIADINPPALETRIAILKKKAEHKQINIPDDVLLYIANKFKRNIRELEGPLNKIIVYASMNKRPIDLDLAKRCLKNMVSDETTFISCEHIQSLVAEQFRISRKDLLSKSRSKKIAQPRQIAMYLTRQLTGMSLPEIGVAFGNKHHSTVLHSIQKIEKSLNTDKQAQAMIQSIERSLR